MTRRCARGCARSRRSGRGGGYRRAHHRLREEGWEVNRKRVQRLWREERLRVPQRKRKRRRLGDSTVPAARLRAERPNQVWAFDFQFDQTADGRALKLLNIVDEFTREALVMLVARSIDADRTVSELERLVSERGAPEHLRMDFVPRNKIGVLCPTGLCARRPLQAGDHGDRQRRGLARGHITVRARRASSAAFRRCAKLVWCGVPPKHLMARSLVARRAWCWC